MAGPKACYHFASVSWWALSLTEPGSGLGPPLSGHRSSVEFPENPGIQELNPPDRGCEKEEETKARIKHRPLCPTYFAHALSSLGAHATLCGVNYESPH